MNNSSINNFTRFHNCLKLWLPEEYKVELRTMHQESLEIKRCVEEFDTYKTYITNKNDHRKIAICGMVRQGHFILSGKSYVWTWKEVYCPNWIYKYNQNVEVWSAPISKPWELYKGRLNIFIAKDTLCIEGNYNSGEDCTLYDFLIDKNLGTLEEEINLSIYTSLLFGKRKCKSNSLIDHPFLPHLKTNKQKICYLRLMILNLLNPDINCTDRNDLKSKRLIGVDWLVGDVCDRLNGKVFAYMMRRIHTHGQLLKKSSYFEMMSHVMRVVRGHPSHGNYGKRELHPSHRGVYCPYRSSEGENIGLVVDLVPDVEIHHYTKKSITDGHANGVVDSFSPCESKFWRWNDGGRINPGKMNSIGIVASQLVYIRHMPPVRASYATTHVRQVNRLSYCQKPVVRNDNSNVSIINGCNVLVLVSGYDGWNIEDAIVCSKSFVERGGFTSCHQERLKSILKKDENWVLPLANSRTRISAKDKLMPRKTKDNTILGISGKTGLIAKNYRVNDGKTEVVVVNSLHKIEVGDKLSSRSGQKGVISHLPILADMPHTYDGVVPDIIINPAHLPSRMTVSQMLESCFGKKALIDGKLINDVERTKLDAESGKEHFICGKTGKTLKNQLFFGTVYYMALHHMVHKKCRARNKGPSIMITGQPTKGGTAHGGLRIGEMERDSLRLRGAGSILKERLCDSCDIIDVKVCQSCGWLEPNIKCCVPCQIVNVKMPRTTRLILMEMYGLGIFPKLHL